VPIGLPGASDTLPAIQTMKLANRLPGLTAARDAARLTSKQVRESLEEFP